MFFFISVKSLQSLQSLQTTVGGESKVRETTVVGLSKVREKFLKDKKANVITEKEDSQSKLEANDKEKI